ncbi:MAG: ammonium transporter [Planctomycetaceae bacterium]|nr:ammonium transporter [Planctomycetaceae bacterium]
MPVQWVNSFDSAAIGWASLCTFILLACALPGIALFYGALLRRPHSHGVVSAGFPALLVLTLAWGIAGYSLSFGPSLGTLPPNEPSATVSSNLLNELKNQETRTDLTSSMGRGGVIGNLDYLFFSQFVPSGDQIRAGFSVGPVFEHLPHAQVFVYQLAIMLTVSVTWIFAAPYILPPARVAVFALIWLVLVYSPLVHWIWGNGWFVHQGGFDGGGSMLYLASAWTILVLFRRPTSSEPEDSVEPASTADENRSHHVVVLGAGLFLVGSLASQDTPSLKPTPFTSVVWCNTLIAACCGGLMAVVTARWLDWPVRATHAPIGLFAGLMAIASGSAVMTPNSAIVVGVFAGTIAAWVIRDVKAMRFDDVRRLAFIQLLATSLGLLATAVFGVSAISSRGAGEREFAGLLETGYTASLVTQLLGILAASVWAIVGSYVAGFLAGWRLMKSGDRWNDHASA